jgi:putative nucleotidyltransferase with HDIG domain
MVNFSQVLQSIFYIAMLSLLLISINILQGGIGPTDIATFGLFFTTLVLYLIFRKGHYRIAGWGLFFSVTALLSYILVFSGGISDNAITVFPVLITFGGLLFGKRFVPVITTLILGELSTIYWLTEQEIIRTFPGKDFITIQDLITVNILLTITGVLIWLTINTIEKNIIQIIESENRLRKSYDDTIDGWGRALELFDKETEGHSLRVTELTVKIARLLEIEEEQIEHIRRGALLHDIGKMGIPEAILNKPGELTAEERKIVEKHPHYTYRLLKDIPFLQKALDIPYYHHERWDGTGYPRKLKGEDIPLAARIFTIVDNWDALTSDRPYRKAWPEDQVIQYLQDQSGKIFDPNLVELVIEVVTAGTEEDATRMVPATYPIRAEMQKISQKSRL